MTSNGRRLQNVKSWISATTDRIFSNFETAWKWRRPAMEELNIEYLGNHWSDLCTILNLSSGHQRSGDQTKIKTAWNEHQWIEDKLKILKVDYLSNYQSFEFLGGSYWKAQRKSQVWLCSAQLVKQDFYPLHNYFYMKTDQKLFCSYVNHAPD